MVNEPWEANLFHTEMDEGDQEEKGAGVAQW